MWLQVTSPSSFGGLRPLQRQNCLKARTRLSFSWSTRRTLAARFFRSTFQLPSGRCQTMRTTSKLRTESDWSVVTFLSCVRPVGYNATALVRTAAQTFFKWLFQTTGRSLQPPRSLQTPQSVRVQRGVCTALQVNQINQRRELWGASAISGRSTRGRKRRSLPNAFGTRRGSIQSPTPSSLMCRNASRCTASGKTRSTSLTRTDT